MSFNGQRCTALKILFVHHSIADAFLAKFSEAVDALKLGLPWEKDTKITPLGDPDKPAYLKTVIADALAKGAKIANKRGGQVDRTFVAPTVLYPVSHDMKVGSWFFSSSTSTFLFVLYRFVKSRVAFQSGCISRCIMFLA